VPKKNPALPKYAKLANGRYVYRPYITKKQRHDGIKTDKYNYLCPPILLGYKDDPIHTIYKKYAEVVEQHNYLNADENCPYLSLCWLYEQYTSGRFFKELAPKTQTLYKTCAGILEHEIEVDGRNTTLSKLPATHLKTTIIRRILDRRVEQYKTAGRKGESICNNEKALLSAMYRYGIQYIDALADMKNPAHGITKYKVAVRDRYVTDEEYECQHKIAAEKSPEYLPIVMELAYLLAARGIEVTDLTISSATSDGIVVKRRKGSKDTIIKWSERLRIAWKAALSLHTIAPQPEAKLLVGRRGHSVTRHAVTKAWQKLKKYMKEAGHESHYFQLHDLKRKGISDAKDDMIAGHVSPVIRANYTVKLKLFDAPD